MKKITVGLLYLCFAPTFIIACCENNDLKVRVAAFIHSSKLFRHIYNPVDPCFELEYARCLTGPVDGWVNADWLYSRGRSVGFMCRTSTKIINFSLGIKWHHQFHECHRIYLGVGPSFGGEWLKNNAFCGCEKISKHAIGVVFKTGIYCDFRQRGFVDFFADYLYQPVRFHTKVDIGGLKIGLGVGAKF